MKTDGLLLLEAQLDSSTSREGCGWYSDESESGHTQLSFSAALAACSSHASIRQIRKEGLPSNFASPIVSLWPSPSHDRLRL